MAGKLCFGQVRNNAGAGHISQSKAYCEGAKWRAQGTALAFPKTDNPHEAGSEDAEAWDLGWDVAQAAAGGTLGTVGCCAYIGAIAI